MSFRTTLVLLVVASALGGYVWLYEREPVSEDGAGEDPVLEAGLEGADVQRLEIRGEQAEVTLERAGEGWRMSAPLQARADKFQVNGLADALAGLSASRKFDEPEDLAAFGLDDPEVEVAVSLKDRDVPRELLFGDKTVDERSVYLKRRDVAAVYLVQSNLLGRLNKPVEEWRDKDLTSVEFNDVVGIEVERSGAPDLAFDKTGDRWLLSRPRRVPADKKEVDALLRDLTGLRIDTFVRDEVEEAALAGYGLDSPRYVVHLKVGETAGTRVEFGASEKEAEGPETDSGEEEEVQPQDAPGKVYARIKGENSVYLVRDTALERLAKPAEEFEFLEPFYAQQWRARGLEVRLEGLEMLLEKPETGNWQVVEPEEQELDYSASNDLLGKLWAVSFEGLAGEGLELPEETAARIRVDTDETDEEGEPVAELLLLGPVEEDGTRLVRRKGEEWVYRLQERELEPFREKAAEILGGEEEPAGVEKGGETEPASEAVDAGAAGAEDVSEGVDAPAIEEAVEDR